MQYDFDRLTNRNGTASLKWSAPDELPMWVADMDFPAAPEILDVMQARMTHGVFGYTTVPDAWRQAYTLWWRQRHGVRFQWRQLVYSPGILPTICACIRTLTKEGDSILLLSPAYNCFYDCIRSNGREVLECSLQYDGTRYHLDLARLARQLALPQTTMLILSNPHNPTGNLWDAAQLACIGVLARENGVTVISDEIHCDLTDPGVSYTPYLAASEENAQNSITCLSPTKAFNLAGLHTSAAVIPDGELRRRIRETLHAQQTDWPNAFAVDAAVAAFTKGGPWLDALRIYLYDSKQTVQQFLRTELPQVHLVPSQATYLLWLDCRTFQPDEGFTLAQSLRKHAALWLADGTEYGSGGEGFLRMNIACPRSLLEEGLRRLKDGLSELNQRT